MRSKRLLWAVALFLVGQGTVLAQNSLTEREEQAKQPWLMLGGNAARLGVNETKWPGSLSLRWTYSTLDATNNPSSPVSDGSYLYVCYGSEIVAIDLETGEKTASFNIGETRFSSSPSVAGRAVIAGADDGYLYAFLRPSPKGRRGPASNISLSTETTTTPESAGPSRLPSAKGNRPSTNLKATLAEGEQLYVSNSCSTCHQVGGIGGDVGPALDNLGKRHSKSWTISYIKNPQALAPRAQMPGFARLSDSQLESLTDYLFAQRGKSLELKWMFRAGRAIQSSPCVVGDMAFFGSDDGRVYGVKTGDDTWLKAPRELWEYETDGRVKSSPAYNNGVVFFSSFDGYFYAVRAEDGSLLWRFGSHKGIPTLLPGGALPGGPAGTTTGAIRYGSSTTSYGYGSSIYGYNPTNPTSQTPYGYTGATSSRLGIPSTQPGVGPTAVPQTYLRTAPGGGTLEELMKWEPLEMIRPNFKMYSSPVVANNKVYLVSDTRLYALEEKTGILRWLFSAQGAILGDPAISERKIFFGTEEGHVYCLNANTSDLIWEQKMETGESFASPVSIFGDVVLFRSRWGTIYGLRMDNGELVWQYKLWEVAKAEPEEEKPAQAAGPSAGPAIPATATGGSRYGIRQVTPSYLGRPGEILAPGVSPYYSPTSPQLPGGPPASSYGAYLSTTPSGYYSPRTTNATTKTTTPTEEQKKAASMIEGLEDKITSGPVPTSGMLITWGNDGAVYCFAPGAVDASPPEIIGAHIQFPGDAYDFAYALALFNVKVKAKPVVALPGAPPLYLSFWAYDQGSGIDPSTISITRNGVPVEHEYRPDEGSVWFIHRFSGPTVGALEDGDYEFVLSVADWAGNVAQKKVVFTIDNSLPPPDRAIPLERVISPTGGTGTTGKTPAGRAGPSRSY